MLKPRESASYEARFDSSLFLRDCHNGSNLIFAFYSPVPFSRRGRVLSSSLLSGAGQFQKSQPALWDERARLHRHYG